jgi:pyruvate,water dikinase
MFDWLRKKKRFVEPVQAEATEERVREKYLSFRQLLSLNTECLEIIVGLQEDLQYVPPRREVVESRVGTIFQKAGDIVGTLDRLTGFRHAILYGALDNQRNEVERYVAAQQELSTPRLAVWLYEVGLADSSEVGGKAAALGEVKNKLGLPVPNGYALTTEAYQQFCGIRHWKTIRDFTKDLVATDLAAIQEISAQLQALVLSTPLPRAVEVAVADRASVLEGHGYHLAVRSSAVGEGPEGGTRTYAGQFLSRINVPLAEVTQAYKEVIAGRFSERAIAYRLSTGIVEVESPMSVLFLPTIRAKASGIMYTRNPSDPRSQELWITATLGLGLDIASGRTPADLFVVSRKRGYRLLSTTVASKHEKIVLRAEGGLTHEPVDPVHVAAPSIDDRSAQGLAEYGMRMEDHFRAPQDIEWAMDENGVIWILQTRPLALVEQSRSAPKGKVKTAALVSGGRTICPGRVSGKAFMVEHIDSLPETPPGSLLFLRRASPEIVRVFPRVSGIVAEWGNVAGHAAALLREFKVPSVFLMEGVFDRVKTGDEVSLDAVGTALYSGALWPPHSIDMAALMERKMEAADPISRNILILNLVDPADHAFRPSGCKSTHDVMRYCHEKAVEAMFTVNDVVLERNGRSAKRLKTDLPLNLRVLDLGGGLRLRDANLEEIEPFEIASLPFQALWRGINHPGVSWRREIPARLSDLASVMASSLTPQEYVSRPLGRQSYLLAADEYMNLNARLAFHFTLVDASLTETPSKNYIAFRFAGGGTTHVRRSLRACFVEECLRHYGFMVDRRSDLVNAWLKRAPATRTIHALDILGRLLASTSQLDMLMTSHDVMKWYVRQFLEGNYRFEAEQHDLPGRNIVGS